MERGNKMNSIDEIIPNDEDYPIINLLFQNKLLKSREINTNTLIITCLDLISRERINIRTNDEIETIKNSKNPILKTNINKELELMENIEFTINSKQMKKLNQRDQTVLKMFKDINKDYQFDLKSMYERMSKKEIAIKFAKYFDDYSKSLKRETKYDESNYKDILTNGNFTMKGNGLKKEWKEFHNHLKSDESLYSLENSGDFDKYLVYGRCFDIERDILKNINNCELDYESPLFDFLRYDGEDLLKIIFEKGVSNSKVERKGDGSIPMGNSKYFVPGFG